MAVQRGEDDEGCDACMPASGSLAERAQRALVRSQQLSERVHTGGEDARDAMAAYDEIFLSRFVHHSTVLEGSTLTSHET